MLQRLNNSNVIDVKQEEKTWAKYGPLWNSRNHWWSIGWNTLNNNSLRTITEEVLNLSEYLAIDSIPAKFMHKVWMAITSSKALAKSKTQTLVCNPVCILLTMSLTRLISCVSQDRRALKPCCNVYRILYLLACSMLRITCSINLETTDVNHLISISIASGDGDMVGRLPHAVHIPKYQRCSGILYLSSPQHLRGLCAVGNVPLRLSPPTHDEPVRRRWRLQTVSK